MTTRNWFHKIKLMLFRNCIWWILAFNKIATRIVPFRVLVGWYYRGAAIEQSPKGVEASVWLIRKHIREVSSRAFFKPMCLEEALTALALARFFKLSAQVYLGMMRSDDVGIKAHAWSSIAGQPVTGHENKEGYHVVFEMT